MPDITSANSVLILSVPDLLPAPVQIQGFSADDIFTTQRVAPVETMMGLDGALSGGYMPTKKPFEIVLMAGSASNQFFDAIQAAQDAGFLALSIFGSLSIPAPGLYYTMNNGFLTGYAPTPDGRKILQPRRFEITWESIVYQPIGIAG
jgi:hypothetical protein